MQTMKADLDLLLGGHNARVCMPTWRRFNHNAARCTLYEAQDVFASLDDVDVIPLEATGMWKWKQHFLRSLMPRDFTKKLIYANPGIKPVRLTQDYELLVVMCQQWYELLYLNAIEGWRDRCRTVVCWLDEIYAGSIHNYGSWLHVLRKFDHIFLPYELSASVLGKTIGRPCHYLPRAIDVLRFSPYPKTPARVIDVLSIGRRWEGIHEALSDWSRSGEAFYIHDTVSDGGDQPIRDVALHRTMLANMVMRSLCFVVAPGKMQEVGETHGQMEIGMRYYEGAAGGAVLIGQALDTEFFRNLFDWPQAVIPLRPDGSDVKEVVQGLRNSPDLAGAISRQNAVSIAARHDWMHRWEVILEMCGVKASPKLAGRRMQLKERTATICNPSNHPTAGHKSGLFSNRV